MFLVIGHHGCSNLQSIVFDSGKNLHEKCFIIFFEIILEIFFEYLLRKFPGACQKLRVGSCTWWVPPCRLPPSVLGSAMGVLGDAVFSLKPGTQDFEESYLASISDPKSAWAVLVPSLHC